MMAQTSALWEEAHPTRRPDAGCALTTAGAACPGGSAATASPLRSGSAPSLVLGPGQTAALRDLGQSQTLSLETRMATSGGRQSAHDTERSA